MDNTYLYTRLKKMIPKNITPRFKKDTELLQWHNKQSKLYSKHIFENNQNRKKQNLIQNSGIKKIYMHSSFSNYQIENTQQKIAIKKIIKYVKNFEHHQTNFIFLGNPGTGKNHLAAAIGHFLIKNNKTVLIITISDLMSHIKSTFNTQQNKVTEKKFIYFLSTIDLLILDEIGIQTNSQYEKIIIHQIIDKRYTAKKATGILSNLNNQEIKNILGKRIIDRINLIDSLWIKFNWSSYRKK